MTIYDVSSNIKKQFSNSPTPTGYPRIQFNFNTNYPDAAQTPYRLRAFRLHKTALKIPGYLYIYLADYKWEGFHDSPTSFRCDNLLEQLTELEEGTIFTTDLS